ncbi:unnamed protein product [Bemisia tabaci]|uniref:C2H2-type domain-containing protein n=1 Tax=Bemisia tabaci TaxID=7038 RepID=A0A9P0A5C5_BEMTA|nr:PREDICTED: zinc finger protein 33B-like [Bemisia tabaci]CAH0384384.1 unnamed protein product [Bemisia tabaci]
MNFSPFGSHFSAAIPGIHQFAAKFSHDSSSGTSNSSTVNGISHTNGHLNVDEGMLNSGNRYTPVSSSGHFTLNQQAMSSKYHRDVGSQMVSTGTSSANSKYQNESNVSTVHHYAVPYGNNPHISENRTSQGDMKRTLPSYPNNQEQLTNQQISPIKRENLKEEDYSSVLQHQQPTMPPSWQSIAAPGSTVADYLSHLPASTLPISLHHFLKYSAENMKKEPEIGDHQNTDGMGDQGHLGPKKKKKKKAAKEKKPRPKPGEIRLTTALDGSTLYCCPECHMAYPDKALLEQHLLGHTMERRFFCDICGAGLKRKDHLTRHKQSHNPDRPFVCTVCMKAFKRKEQLTLHFVIHSGEKRHVCPECGKGFYRKDHLRKHTRSHIARRVKAELSQHIPTQNHVGTDPMS